MARGKGKDTWNLLGEELAERGAVRGGVHERLLAHAVGAVLIAWEVVVRPRGGCGPRHVVLDAQRLDAAHQTEVPHLTPVLAPAVKEGRDFGISGCRVRGFRVKEVRVWG